ncbi:glutaminyl-peptide cyclotransferase [Novosphingobium sp.]|uniref:glutaminyl-peptide cyclotransferase n=1 Tax=Novosphingobium sp. TaxID=1874826 RepID=UPI00370372D3
MAPLAAQPAAPTEIPLERAALVKRFPHDPAAFTQGLFIDRGQLFESTGMVGRSSVRLVDLASGKVLKSAAIPAPHFGEGIAPWNGQVLSLTWQSGLGFRWGRGSLRQIGTFRYSGEGWALTSSGKELVMSDGTDTLRFIDPKRFAVLRSVKVTIRGRPLNQINELEWIEGQLFANIWMTDYVVRIDPASGKVIGIIDLGDLHRDSGAFGHGQVANGIAWDARTRKLYLTGKEWPWLYEVKLEPAGSAG